MMEEGFTDWLFNFTSSPTNDTFTQVKDVVSHAHEDLDTDDNNYTPYEERPETYIVPVVFAFIFVVGVLGNGTLVIIFLRHRGMRNVPNTYIFSLALADLLVIVTSVPFVSVIYTFESWPWGGAICRLSECARDISTGVSVFTLTALSAERYCAIVNPLRKLQTRSVTVFCASLIWVLAVICALPAAIFSDAVPLYLEGPNHTIVICDPFVAGKYKDVYRKSNAIAKALIYFLLPLSVIACFYIMMARRLQASARELPGAMQSAQSISQVKARRHVARMVLAFVLVFVACFLPHHIFMLWFHLNPNTEEEYDEWWNAFRIVGFCFGFSNSCVNPITLYCVSGVFRQHFNRYLFCQKPVGGRTSRRSRSQALETSFNSTYRRHTQDTHVGGSYRSQRNITSDAFKNSVMVTSFESTGNKQGNSTSYLLKNMDNNIKPGHGNNQDGCYNNMSNTGATMRNSIRR